MIFVANISEKELANSNNSYNMEMLLQYCKEKNQPLIMLSGAIEMEIASIPKNEQKEFLQTYNLSESGLSKMISEAYKILALETFFTAGPKEIRAWPIIKGATAPQAAGVIHTDFQRGFIKAEVYNIKDLIDLKSEHEIKSAGRLRQEGKDYIINNGDIIFFKFNV
jgi:ribosome-binding ATPase YchF (GTP1/OBG family)